MKQGFTTLYDIQTVGGVSLYSTDQIDALIFAFVVVSTFLAILCLAPRKKETKSLFLIPMLAIGMLGYLGVEYWDRHATIAALADGKMANIAGCVVNFETNTGDLYSGRSSRPDEQWDIQSEHFSYKVTSDAPGYHRREVAGGVVHGGQYLRVGYLISPILRRQEIMKIEVGSRQCR